MGNKTIYIKDDALWRRARELAGKDGLSSAIQGFLAEFVEKAQLAEKGFARQRVAVREEGAEEVPTKHIAFNGRLVHRDTISASQGPPTGEIAAFETKAGKLVLTLKNIDFDGDAVDYYAVYDNLSALGKDDLLREQVQEEERVNFLDALSERLGQEWAVWIE